jgi:hypothetical protein
LPFGLKTSDVATLLVRSRGRQARSHHSGGLPWHTRRRYRQNGNRPRAPLQDQPAAASKAPVADRIEIGAGCSSIADIDEVVPTGFAGWDLLV